MANAKRPGEMLRLASHDRKSVLAHLANDMKSHQDKAIQGVGRMILQWLADGDSPEMIGNHMDAVVRDLDNIRKEVHKILGTEQEPG